MLRGRGERGRRKGRTGGNEERGKEGREVEGGREKNEREGGTADVAVAVGRGVSYLARAALPKHPWVAVSGATTTPRAA